MSLGEADAKFPGQATGLPPSPSRENPGQISPTPNPGIEQAIGNPFLMNNALQKLDHALGDVLEILENEESAQGSSREENTLLWKFREWKDDLQRMRSGNVTASEQEGGMFTD
ncbi:hypothetical protein BDQ12DRAFT_699583 [Crucibulum laeve]|uniref:Uncharacterized protein n=1 Tax=Crucibulum laeve TaxID=68775 RepID=A0A5C3LUV6_9AGAR|nr:hypothetical protein BDQ12DRAFT_699583 [Crucibulum laeve]